MIINHLRLESFGYKVVANRGIPQRYKAMSPDGVTITKDLLSKDAAWLECQAHFECNGKSILPPTIGGRLRLLRGDQSQFDVSEATGIAPSLISMFEHGKREPSITQLYILATYYGINLSKFFDSFRMEDAQDASDGAADGRESGSDVSGEGGER